MKQTIFALLCMFASSCGAAVPGGAQTDGQPASAANFNEMLKKGSPQACADGDVLASLSELIAAGAELQGAYAEFLRTGEKLDYAGINLSGRNREILEVTCEANLLVVDEGIRIQYKIRPAAGDPTSFAVDFRGANRPKEEVATALLLLMSESSMASGQRSEASAVASATSRASGENTIPEIKGGTDYSLARQRLVRAGFRPARISRGDPYDLCELTRCPPFQEAISCSGTGVNECRFAFMAPDGRLAVVITFGEGDDPSVERVEWASAERKREIRNRIAGRPAMAD